MCGKVRHAIAAVEAGCDFVIAQGTEAGGHTGTVATMPLVPQIVDEVGDRVPVVAAGGIFDGRGLAAAIALGADGVWLGTRFIATPEARTVRGYKDALLRTPEDGTVISRGFTGKTLRAVRNEWTQHIEEHPEELTQVPRADGRRPSRRTRCTSAATRTPTSTRTRSATRPGRASARSHELVPAGDLVRQIVDEAEHALARGRDDRRRLSASDRLSGRLWRCSVGEVVLVHHAHELLEARPAASSRASGAPSTRRR